MFWQIISWILGPVLAAVALIYLVAFLIALVATLSRRSRITINPGRPSFLTKHVQPDL